MKVPCLYVFPLFMCLPEHLISPLVFTEVHVVLSLKLCLLISCYSLDFLILSFDCFICLIAWYLYLLPGTKTWN